MAEEWYYLKGEQQIGPVTKEKLLEAYQWGEINSQTLVWNNGMPDWQPAGKVQGLLPVISTLQSSPQPMQPTATPYGASYGPTPGMPVATPSYAPPKPASNLVWAILALICCCWPAAIPAIVYAAKVDSRYDAGDYAGAQEAADKTKTWLWVSFIAGLIAWGIGILLNIAAAGIR